jgi:hypothetical protein
MGWKEDKAASDKGREEVQKDTSDDNEPMPTQAELDAAEAEIERIRRASD